MFRIHMPLLLGLTLACPAVFAADLVAYSAQWPPYTFERQGKVVGIAADLLRQACHDAHLDCRLELLPWARAYQTAKTTQNTLVYPTTRTMEREPDFRWLGPMGNGLPGDAWVWRLKSHPVDAVEYLQLNRYRVGVVVGDSPVQELWLRGVQREAMDFADSNESNIRKFLTGRVDVVVDTDLGMAWQLGQNGIAADSAVHLLPYASGTPSYFALNKTTSRRLAERLEAAITNIVRRNELKTIVQRYVKAP